MASLVYADEVRFQNELAACITIKLRDTARESNVVVANTSIHVLKPIGECGCLSALASYVSSVNRGGVQQTLQQGLIGLIGGGEKSLVLATEPSLVANKEVRVRLACAGPL